MIVDQAEELITLSGPAECDAFLGLLARALDADPRLWIIVIMRSEFLTGFLGTVQARFRDPVAVGTLGHTALVEVIEQPARRAGLTFKLRTSAEPRTPDITEPHFDRSDVQADQVTPNSYRERPAPASLAGVVACFWSHDPYPAQEQRVLPDGCRDLIWMDGAVHIAGPDTRAFIATLDKGQTFTGLRFRPGAAPGVLGVPAYPLRDQRVRLDDLWPGETLTSRIEGADDPATVLAAAVASRATEPDRALSAVLARLRDGSSVRTTADSLGWTERALHRRCRNAFGYGPSVLRRILRFRTALRLAVQGVPFAVTATRTGYADQAHLAREVRALAGVPLSQLLTGNGANRSTPTPSGSCTTA